MKTLLLALIGLCIASCEAPKAIVVAEAPKVKPVASKPFQPVVRVTPDLDDGLRLGDDILALPSSEQLRSSPEISEGSNAPVITRPPAE